MKKLNYNTYNYIGHYNYIGFITYFIHTYMRLLIFRLACPYRGFSTLCSCYNVAPPCKVYVNNSNRQHTVKCFQYASSYCNTQHLHLQKQSTPNICVICFNTNIEVVYLISDTSNSDKTMTVRRRKVVYTLKSKTTTGPPTIQAAQTIPIPTMVNSVANSCL